MHLLGMRHRIGRGYRTTGATIRELFAALPAGTPGLCYRFADSRFNSAARNGSTGFGATSGPLGLVLDQARGALDALGAELVVNGSFSTGDLTGWTPVTTGSGSVVFSAGAAVVTGIDGSNTARLRQTTSYPTVVGRMYRLTFTATVTGSGFARVGTTAGGNDILNATFTAGTTLVFVATSTTTWLEFSAGVSANTVAIDNISVREIPGTQSWALSDAARPTLGGFAGGATLSSQFNGTNSALQSVAPFDLSGTDEVTVIAVVRKKSDSAAAILAELGVGFPSITGSWYVAAPELTGASGNYSTNSQGSVRPAPQINSGTFLAPHNAIVVVGHKIATPLRSISINRGAAVTSAANQGSGNYSASHLLNIGARNAASLFANMDLAALCIVGLEPRNLPAGWMQTMTGLLVPPDAVFS